MPNNEDISGLSRSLDLLLLDCSYVLGFLPSQLDREVHQLLPAPGPALPNLQRWHSHITSFTQAELLEFKQTDMTLGRLLSTKFTKKPKMPKTRDLPSNANSRSGKAKRGEKGKEDFSGNVKKRKPGKNGVPDRWEDYCKIGTVVEGTNFIPFKVPLKQVILDKVTEGVDNKWSVEDVIEAVPSPGLGLVIDLTFTTRYYDPKIFTSNKIEHKKILTKGHDIPDNALVDEFNEAVDEMVHSDGTKLIGVHCTHGLNRTGYLVCRYMIQKLAIQPEVAIAAFDAARGHKQERGNYLNHLKAKGWQNREP